MRLSMQMLADRLRQYDPEPDIRKNERHLQSVRLFSENLRYTASTVYLMPMEQGKIVCSNENDILVLHADDTNEVFNEILDIFEYFQNAEDTAAELIDGGCTAKELLEYLSGMTGYFLILADAGFYMRETAGAEEIARSHVGLHSMIGQHLMPVDVLKKINAEPKIRMHGIAPYLTEVPGLGTACVANLFANGHHEGWLVACKETFDFSDGERDLLDCAARIMERWFIKNESSEEQSKKAGMFLEILHGTAQADAGVRDRLRAFGWMDADRKQVFVIRLSPELPVPPDTAARRLEVLFPDAFVLREDMDLVLLVNYALNQEKDVRDTLARYLDEISCFAGESGSFQDIRNLKQEADTARTAALYAGKTSVSGKRICRFADMMLPYLGRVLREHALPAWVHPAIRQLEAYDREHEAELEHTLQVFLQENCSHTAAARELFIHRSTLLYRLDRIGEITGVDLRDPEERFRLLLSIYLNPENT